MEGVDDIKQLLNYGMDLARKRIQDDGFINPFGIAIDENDEYQMIETLGQEHTGLEGLIDSFKEKKDVKAAFCCVDSKTTPSGETVQMKAIEIVLESANQCLHGYQFYGLNLDGELVFAPLDVKVSEALIF
jgi:hypothetical protein